MPKRGGLGRGLDALIPNKQADKAAKAKNKSGASKKSSNSGKSDNVSGSAGIKEKAAKPDIEKKKKTVKEEPAAPAQEIKIPAEEYIDDDDLLMAEYDNEPGNEPDNEPEKNEEAAERTSEVKEDKKTSEKPAEKASYGNEVINMKISLVEPNRDQPRKYFDDAAIEELADSVRQFGIIQPLLVQKVDDYYQIIAGERRWRAAIKAGLKEIPVIVRNFSNQEAVEVALVENIQREDLNPIEEAKAYQRLVSEYNLSQEEVAAKVSKSRSSVTNSMRLLKLDPDVQTMVETGILTEGHARTLLPVPVFEVQRKMASQVVKEGLSVRQTEKMVRDLLRPGQKRTRKEDSSREAMLNSLSEQLQSALGTKVSIRQSGKNKGKIEIEYYSDEELDRIYEMLRSLR